MGWSCYWCAGCAIIAVVVVVVVIENPTRGLVSFVVIALTNTGVAETKERILLKLGLETAGVPSRRIAAQRRGNPSVQLNPRWMIGLGTRRPWSWIETILSKLLPS